MFTRSIKNPCWKCGRQVDHRRTLITSAKSRLWIRRLFHWGGYVIAPVKHYVEREKGFELCAGSEVPRRTHVAEGNKKARRMKPRWRID